MTTYLLVRDPDGNQQTIIHEFARLEYVRAENQVGELYLDLSPDHEAVKFFRLNTRIEVWRQVGQLSPYLEGETVYFVKDWGWETDAQGKEVYHLEALDANDWLAMRNVAYYSDDAETSQTDQIDDMCKVIVRQNLGASADDALRQLGGLLTVQADASACASTTKAFSRRQVLTILQDLAAESLQQGTYLAFDTVYTGAATLEFRTYTGQRGINHGRSSALPVVISRERGNLEEPALWERHSGEFNFIYAGGQGEGAARIVQTASNADALTINRREKWIDARNTATTAAILSEAQAGLTTYRAKKTLTGKIKDTDGCMYGVHYRFGDLVYAEYRGKGYDAHIDAIHVAVTDKGEIVDCKIRAEE